MYYKSVLYCEINELETIYYVLFNCNKFELQRIPFVTTRKGFSHSHTNIHILEDIYNLTQLCEIKIWT